MRSVSKKFCSLKRYCSDGVIEQTLRPVSCLYRAALGSSSACTSSYDVIWQRPNSTAEVAASSNTTACKRRNSHSLSASASTKQILSAPFLHRQRSHHDAGSSKFLFNSYNSDIGKDLAKCAPARSHASTSAQANAEVATSRDLQENSSDLPVQPSPASQLQVCPFMVYIWWKTSRVLLQTLDGSHLIRTSIKWILLIAWFDAQTI